MAKEKASKKQNQKSIPKKKAVEKLEDTDIFTLTNETTSDTKLLKNKRKNNDTKNQKKKNNHEDRKIKRIKEMMENTGSSTNNNKKTNDDIVYDLWETNTSNTQKISIEPLKYPRLIIPHPGQSYNPNREDLKNLLHTIVEINKPKVEVAVEPVSKIELEEGKFETSEEEAEEEKKQEDIKISNNPPVCVEDRLTRRERNKIHKSKLNKLKNIEQQRKKSQKIDINSTKLFNTFKKDIEKKKLSSEDLKKKEQEDIKRQNELINMGIYFKDTDVLDYKINKKGVSLKNLTSENSLISERFENIMKRKIVGENSVKNKKNRKLNKIHYRENQDFFFEEDDQKLKIIN